MTMLLCWVVFPVLLGALCLGCGLLVEALVARRLPSALVAPLGFAVIAVAADLATSRPDTAELATPLVVALAIAGLILSPPWRRWGGLTRGRLWALAGAAGVFAAFAAPVVLSGQATFAGYIKLDDTATFLTLIDRVMDHGREFASLSRSAPSSYEATLFFNLGTGYPLGSLVGLGVGGKLIGQDIAWLYQPYMTVIVSLLALVLYELARPAIPSRAGRALISLVAAQTALLYGYAMWGGIKEIAAALLIALASALIPTLLEGSERASPFAAPPQPRAWLAVLGSSARQVLPLALVSAATLDALSAAAVIWLAPGLLLAVGALARVRGVRELGRQLGTFVALGALLALPALITASTFLRPNGTAALTGADVLGNLIRPLDEMQLFGIWPTGDFRLAPANMTATKLLVLITAAGGLLALAQALARRWWGLLAYLACAGIGVLAFDAAASPWVAGKGMASASPAFLLFGLLGAGSLWPRGRRAESAVVVLALAGGVLFSNVLAYRDVNLAPRPRLAELEYIGHRFAGQGPSLMTEYEPFGVRHFLRDLAPEGASELRRRVVPLLNGSIVPKSAAADLDRFQLAGILVYRTLVLRRSPAQSRPPASYRLAWQGRYYDVWQRSDPPGPVVLAHLGLGDSTQAGAVARCADVLRMARQPGAARLAAAATRLNAVLDLSPPARAPSWSSQGEGAGSVIPGAAATVGGSVTVPASGSYEIFLRGAFRPRVSLAVDGRTLASQRHQLTHSNDDLPFARADLTAGPHQVTLGFGGADLHPGSGGLAYAVGPLLLGAGPDDHPITYVALGAARSLCGRRLDWVEAIGA